jgi:hypothetical protein
MAAKVSRLDLIESWSTISIWLHDDGSLLMRVCEGENAIGVPFSVELLSPKSQTIMMGWFGRCGHAGRLAFEGMANECLSATERGAA